MTRSIFTFFAALVSVNLLAQGDTPEAHVAIARRLAAEDKTPLVTLCDPPAPAAPAAAPAAAGNPPPSAWAREPMRVFDNLYYVGEKEYSSWALTTSGGIIILDAIYDYSVEQQVAGGLKKLGLDPANIKYVIVSHAHRDHAGGAWYLQERYGARVIMSDADWTFLNQQRGTWPKPKRDMVAVDGQHVTLGDTTVTLYATPGHTPGTISMLVPVRDRGEPHVAAYLGGTGFNFSPTPEKPMTYWFDHYVSSVEHFRDAAAKAGADVFLSNHPKWDDTDAKMKALADREIADPHPYIVGAPAVQHYLTIASECAKAGKLRLK